LQFRTFDTPDGTAVAICPHVDQNCPTIRVAVNGQVVIGSTENSAEAFLTPDEFEALLTGGAQALERARQAGGGDVVIRDSAVVPAV